MSPVVPPNPPWPVSTRLIEGVFVIGLILVCALIGIPTLIVHFICWPKQTWAAWSEIAIGLWREGHA